MMDEMFEKGKKIKMLDDNGNEVECEIKMVYLCEENGKTYVFYSDNTTDADGNLDLSASILTGQDENGEPILEEIVDENEWALLDKVLEDAKKGVE